MGGRIQSADVVEALEVAANRYVLLHFIHDCDDLLRDPVATVMTAFIDEDDAVTLDVIAAAAPGTATAKRRRVDEPGAGPDDGAAAVLAGPPDLGVQDERALKRDLSGSDDDAEEPAPTGEASVRAAIHEELFPAAIHAEEFAAEMFAAARPASRAAAGELPARTTEASADTD